MNNEKLKDEVILVGQSGYIEWCIARMPELPKAKRERYKIIYGLSDYEVGVLTDTDAGGKFKIGNRNLYEFFEEVVGFCGDAKSSVNWILNNLLSELKKKNLTIHTSHIKAEWVGELINLINDKTINTSIAKIVFEKMSEECLSPSEIIQKHNLIVKIDTNEIEKIIDNVLVSNQKMVDEYKSGKVSVLGHFMGQIMKQLKGADAKSINQLLRTKLEA